ncbi:hypothetical protein PSCICM_14820 [Pseudomonas cichorii]|uniref:Uncharacterized protein n=1 Tax=Pseudomonas cichorii TaxID=36746 RepID=A0ABQ1DI74_PSECI|nr:hypothetical protein PCH70_18750 [Pseudomonas cichorii JBC1]GFM75663.1 hypothetical protein PSCICM_14820 [Pseudomonas cichorii]GFM90684.1 hypothetical protein PSCICP_06560 [Pseudomonas cichorii]
MWPDGIWRGNRGHQGADVFSPRSKALIAFFLGVFAALKYAQVIMFGGAAAGFIVLIPDPLWAS